MLDHSGGKCQRVSMKSLRHPCDTSQLAKVIVDIAAAEGAGINLSGSSKNPAAILLGRLDGKKNGTARAASLASLLTERSRQVAKSAASRYWDKEREG
jgi:hypothetical protein